MPESCRPIGESDFTTLPALLEEARSPGEPAQVVFGEGGLRLKGQRGYREERRFPSVGWEEVVALAVDRCDQIHLLDKLDEKGRLWLYDQEQERGEARPCLFPIELPTGLAVSERTLFVSEGPSGRVAALSRGNGQLRWIWEERGADPGDLAFFSDRLYLLDRARPRMVVLGPDGSVTEQFDLPLDEGVPKGKVRMAIGRDGLIYLWGGKTIRSFDREGREISRIDPTPAIPEEMSVAALAADEAGIVYLGDGAPLPAGMEERRRIYRLLPGESRFQPLFGYTGPAFQMAFDLRGNLFVIAEEGTLVRLRNVVSYPLEGGVFYLPPFDSGREKSRWHKILLEGERPEGTRVSIRFLITDERKKVEELMSLPLSAWSDPISDFTDALIPGEKVEGRFLALRGELTTNHPLITPSVTALTAVFPRQSYLRYLPSIYQDDPAGRAFLERFLSLFETLAGRLEAGIDDLPLWIDPAAAPAEAIPWLSSWLALEIEEGWSEAQRRIFLAEAIRFYRKRGTREGILESVERITRQAPILVESFQLDCIEDARLLEEYRQVYGASGCHFCLIVDLQTATQPETMAMIRRMVEEQVPAHVGFGVAGLRPWFYLGRPTYLEINTVLSRPILRLEESVLGGGEVGLVDIEEAGQVERAARIGLDTTVT